MFIKSKISQNFFDILVKIKGCRLEVVESLDESGLNYRIGSRAGILTLDLESGSRTRIPNAERGSSIFVEIKDCRVSTASSAIISIK